MSRPGRNRGLFGHRPRPGGWPAVAPAASRLRHGRPTQSGRTRHGSRLGPAHRHGTCAEPAAMAVCWATGPMCPSVHVPLPPFDPAGSGRTAGRAVPSVPRNPARPIHAVMPRVFRCSGGPRASPPALHGRGGDTPGRPFVGLRGTRSRALPSSGTRGPRATPALHPWSLSRVGGNATMQGKDQHRSSLPMSPMRVSQNAVLRRAECSTKRNSAHRA